MALKPLNSVAGFSVGETPVVVIDGNGNVIANNLSTSGIANLGPISNVIITGGSNGQVIQTDGLGNLSFTTIDTWRIQNGTSNVQIATSNGNVTVSVAGNANIATFTSTGANINGYLTVEGTVSANGNLSANNYLVTPATRDLIIAPATQLTRIYANVNPYTDLAYDLGNGLARWSNIFANNANYTGNVSVSDTASVGNLRTDNLLYANGTPWDLQEAAGANYEIQFNIDGNFTASPNLTFNNSTQVLTLAGNLVISNATATNGILTDNLYYANGTPWDLQEAAGSNTQIQYNDGLNNFGASANFTYDDATQQLTVNGTANVSTLNASNVANVGNLNVVGNVTSNLVPSSNATYNLGNATNLWGNVYAQNFVGNISGNLTAPGSNTQIIFNDANVANAVANFTYNKTYNTGGGLLNVGNTFGGQITTDNVYVAYANINGNVDTSGNVNVTGDVSANNLNASSSISITTAGNFTMTGGNISGVNHISSNTANFTSNVLAANLTVNNEISGNTANFSGNVVVPNLTVNLELAGNTANFSSNVQVNNLDVNVELSGNTANFSGNVVVPNLTVNLELAGNTANFSGNVIVPNLTVNNEISGNTANFSGNVVVPNLTVNLELAGNTANFTGNVVAANFIGSLANGDSNVKVYANSNIEITVNGISNTATFSSTGLYVVGEIHSTAGNILANGNVTANGIIAGANAEITGRANVGSLMTSNIIATSGNITISAAAGNESIILTPTGTGVVSVSGKNITNLADPVNPTDAVTKEYVDSIAQGLTIHAPVRVESNVNLTGTYTQGGTTQTTTDITGGKTITFSANHGLSVDDGIVWTNSFNGIVGGEAYWVANVPALNQITISDGYHGPEITTLTNATGLSQASRANPGVGATLVNSGANAALVIDSVAVANGDRVLVYSQTSAFENGVYDVTDKGNSTAAWVLTRSTDMDKYIPQSTLGMGYGDYFFIQEGATAAGESYVLTAPQGEIIIGTDNLTFTQFSQAGSYTAGNGIAINGTVISANVDNETTAIVSGNIVVKTSANLTTPNIGDATFSSLSWNTLSNGNVTANNLSLGNIANIGTDLTVGNVIVANGNITSNATVNGNNLFITNNANVQGNILGANITANSTVFTANANVSGTTITDFLTVNNAITGNTANFSSNVVVNNFTTNLEFVGNTANFSGNVVLPNLTVNLELAGNTANFSGNVIVPNLTVNNSITGNTANFSGNVVVPNLTVNLELAGNTANFSSNIVASNIKSNLEFVGNTANFSGNVVLPNLTVNLELAGNTANFTGNINALNANLGNLATANFFTGTFINGTSNIAIPTTNGNINFTSNANTTFIVTDTGANVTGNLAVTGDLSVGNATTTNITANTSLFIGDTVITWANVTTTSTSANQTISSYTLTGNEITGINWLVKAVDSTGSKYSVASVQAVTDGTSVDYSVYGTVQLGGFTGSLAVNVVGSTVRLQVTPASSNSTVWTTQYRMI